MSNPKYIRQTALKNFGPEAQEKLSAAKVLVVGAGGLGVPVLQYLNAMGIGTLGIVDHDRIELSNLHRQVLYDEGDIGKYKADVAGKKLSAQNSDTEIQVYRMEFKLKNAEALISDFDLVIDATDNFATRYLINDVCVLNGKPFVYGGLYGYEGQVSIFNYENGPSLRCLFPEMPGPDEVPDCNINGVLGVLPAIIGNFQALEAVKLITGIGELSSGKLMIYDGWNQRITKVGIKRVASHFNITELAGHYEEVSVESGITISPEEINKLMLSHRDLMIIDVRENREYNKFHLEGSLNVPLSRLNAELGQIPETEAVLVVCQSGIRSRKAVSILSELKIPIYELKGGINNYLYYADNR
ncbi:HesA/MoeB/ThiF family protein [Robertkochia solimangrovi]|uniref:HesA/MoeB/ThiF family protein n=1 Tax=Robertkochia solimangrovi TaxID=2213046 RepID=UPI00117F379F|nr:HesA/MoeB/ThiF family protein [Robertkochia solimangrovi]TRZ43270.1 sulfurtransferase [Robertkochia solimangrovi]